MLLSLLKRHKFAPVHLLLWVLVWLFYVYFFSYNTANQSFVFWFSSSLLPVTMAATYLFSNEIIPKYLLQQKYALFTLYSVYTVIGSLFLILIIVFFGFMLKAYFNVEAMPLLMRNFVFVFILVYLVVGGVSFVNIIRFNYKANHQNRLLQHKVLESKLLLKEKELKYLKQQIHPHFLFNTLNTIYASALKESKDTPALVLKLSTLLDYVLNQIEKPLVSIEDEVEYITSYIGLERIRFKDTMRVSFQKEITSSVQVPPMLFMVFIENAFKHGGRVNDLLDIAINLYVDATRLEFQIENTVNNKGSFLPSHGVGLTNIKNRLDTQYANQYTLHVTQDEKRYHVMLKIDLKIPSEHD